MHGKAGFSNLDSYHEMEIASSGHLCNKKK